MTQREAEISKAVVDILNGRLDGDCEALTKYVDVFIRAHPASVIDLGTNHHVCLAAMNHGPFTTAVQFSLELQGTGIAIDGDQSGSLLVRPPRKGDRAYLNWSSCPVRAEIPDRESDCVCSWNALEGQHNWTATTLLKLFSKII